MTSKPSHGPLIAILGGTALVAAGTCGGGAFLFVRGFDGMQQLIEERRGPREIVDEDYRVRVTTPTDEDPSWELWDAELAQSWDPAGIVVLRNETCAAGLTARPATTTRSLEAQLLDASDAPTHPITPPRGASGEARTRVPDEAGVTSLAFVHGGQLFEVTGDGACASALYDAIEITPGELRPRWITPAIEDQIGRSYRVEARVFESAASGLHVDGSEPFSLELEDLVRSYGHAELAVRHRNGTVVSLDPYLGFEPSPSDPARDHFVVRVLGGDVTFEQPDAALPSWVGVATRGDMGIALSAVGPDRDRVIEALEALALRLDLLDDTRLSRLRASMPAPADRRAGASWSLRNGVFREHPLTPRPRVELVVPEWAEVIAGSELLAREDPGREGVVALFERPDLGLTGRLSVEPAVDADARVEIARFLTFADAPVEHGPIEGDASHATAELVLEPGSARPRGMRVELFVREGWSFLLEHWWDPRRAEEARVVALGTAQLFAIEEDQSFPASSNERLGFEIDAGQQIEPRSTDERAEAGAFVSTPDQHLQLIAMSDARPSATRTLALDELGMTASVSAIWARRAEPTLLDGRAATVRSLSDLGLATRIVETRIDRTTYLVVVRGSARTDWQAELARVDLDR
ncbi:MAG: hypothetical protein U0353_23615 [Sandaracinus sp.]